MRLAREQGGEHVPLVPAAAAIADGLRATPVIGGEKGATQAPVDSLESPSLPR
jgi:hypothetical protein